MADGTSGGGTHYAMMVIFFVISGIGLGMSVTVASFRKALLKRHKPLIVGICTHFMFVSLFVYCMNSILDFDAVRAFGTVLHGAVGSSVSGSIVAACINGDVALAITLNLTTTIVSLAVVPWFVAMYFDTSYDLVVGTDIDFLSIVIIAVVVGCSVGFGVVIARYVDEKQRTTVISRVLIGLSVAVWAAIIAVLTVRESHIFDDGSGVWWFVVASNVCTVVVAFMLALLAKLHPPEVRTICVVTGASELTAVLASIRKTFSNDQQRERASSIPMLYAVFYFLTSFLVIFPAYMYWARFHEAKGTSKEEDQTEKANRRATISRMDTKNLSVYRSTSPVATTGDLLDISPRDDVLSLDDLGIESDVEN